MFVFDLGWTNTGAAHGDSLHIFSRRLSSLAKSIGSVSFTRFPLSLDVTQQHTMRTRDYSTPAEHPCTRIHMSVRVPRVSVPPSSHVHTHSASLTHISCTRHRSIGWHTRMHARTCTHAVAGRFTRMSAIITPRL